MRVCIKLIIVFIFLYSPFSSVPFKAPEDERQQWDVIVNVYSRGGSISGESLVAYHRLPCRELPPYIDTNPRTPSWIPLRMMPQISGVNYAGAVLMVLEKIKTETVVRGK